MLYITIPASEQWNEQKQEFVHTKAQTLQLEHSLVSVAKWEAKWNKVFLSSDKTNEEAIDYIRCMTITQNVDPNVYFCLTGKNIADINDYIKAPMTATWFTENKVSQRRNSEQVTAELIYYWMIALNIPFECQKWHLNRLLTLIRVCNIKNQPKKNRSKRDIMRQNTAINAARRKKMNSRG